MADRRLPSGTVTFLFTDIEGSTRLNAELGDDRWSPVLERHGALLREAIGGRRGFVIKTIGDGFFAVFGEAADAVAAAADAQRALAAEPWPAEAPPAWRDTYLAAYQSIDTDPAGAAASFARLAAERPDDPVPRIMAERIAAI